MDRDAFFLGIPDSEFIRETGIPMTKNEIRVLSLSKMRLFEQAVVYDIGAGTGSLGIQCRLLFPGSQVYAVEKDPEAINLIKKNCRKFETELNIIEGAAPWALEALPSADSIFIGGSGGELPEIILKCHKKLKAGRWMVLNTVTLNSGPQAYSILEKLGYEVEGLQVNISVCKSVGKSQLWQARNPVTIVSARKGDKIDGAR